MLFFLVGIDCNITSTFRLTVRNILCECNLYLYLFLWVARRRQVRHSKCIERREWKFVVITVNMLFSRAIELKNISQTTQNNSTTKRDSRNPTRQREKERARSNVNCQFYAYSTCFEPLHVSWNWNTIKSIFFNTKNIPTPLYTSHISPLRPQLDSSTLLPVSLSPLISSHTFYHSTILYPVRATHRTEWEVCCVSLSPFPISHVWC